MRVVLARLGGCLVLAFGLVACGSKGQLELTPSSLEFGEIDFQEDMPEGGYGVTEVTLTNVGEDDLLVRLPTYDDHRLCIQGWDEPPVEIPTLGPGSSYLLYFGICGYEIGELMGEVESSILFSTDGVDEQLALPYSYKPIRDQDTG